MSLTTTGGNSLVPQSLDQAAKLAEMMSRGKLVPGHLAGSPGDCLMVIEQAMRWNMSPFAVAQATSVIQGKLMFEGKLVAAALQSSGILASRLNYEYAGQGADRSITVSAVLNGEKDARSVVVALKDAKTNNGMWTKQPDQQLAYHGARVWARRYAPEVMLGVYAPEEMEPSPPRDDFRGTTIDAKAEASTPDLTERFERAISAVQEADVTEAAFVKIERKVMPLLADLDAAGHANNKRLLAEAMAEYREAVFPTDGQENAA